MKQQLIDFYNERIGSFLKHTHNQTLEAEAEKMYLDEQVDILFERRQKADLVKQRFEVLAREYNDQNKQFEQRHTEITKQEREKREQIRQGFEDHLKGIKDQLGDENTRNQEAIDSIDKENNDLAEKYDELKKEIDEKSK